MRRKCWLHVGGHARIGSEDLAKNCGDLYGPTVSVTHQGCAQHLGLAERLSRKLSYLCKRVLRFPTSVERLAVSGRSLSLPLSLLRPALVLHPYELRPT